MDAKETRRLHELAARAIGLSDDYRYCEAWKCMAVWNDADGGWFDWLSAWRPLVDDGDSRRLEVKLGIKSRWHNVLWQGLVWTPNDRLVISVNGEDCGDDPCAAVRLAVLRAAAAIGEVMMEMGIAGFKSWPATHLKSGNEYRVIGEAIDTTNATEGRTMVIYRGNGHTFVREVGEFTSKFAAMKGGDS